MEEIDNDRCIPRQMIGPVFIGDLVKWMLIDRSLAWVDIYIFVRPIVAVLQLNVGFVMNAIEILV